MTVSLPVLDRLPAERASARPFDPPAELAAIRARHPLCPLRFPDGHLGWLATGHEAVRAILADRRFSSRQELMHLPDSRANTFEGSLPAARPGMFIATDAPEHTGYRRLLTARFTVRRMRLLTERVEQLAAEHLDAMQRQQQPVDLVRAYAHPIPALMICELLGVPSAHHETFARQAAVFSDYEAGVEQQGATMRELGTFLHELVRAKRAAPTDDLLSELTSTELTDEELTNIAVLLLGAGLDTTTNVIGLGTFALLSHPGQLAELRAQPELTDRAVEELLRYLSVAHTGGRVALEDVEVSGALIHAGQTVALSVAAANRDPARYPDPDKLDLRRENGGHIAFGHGIHQCLGQQLARVELRAALPALLRRFPGLRLAVAPEQVPLRTGSDVYGVHRLPVAWD